ncbi:MAG: DUF3187 family protein [Planctomycetes bacterium]|nr:DUF3187 family protein [Planctomycetota bacterium]
MRRLLAPALALILAAPTPAVAEEAAPAAEAPPPLPQWGRGPLEVRDPFILSLSRLSPWARSPAISPHLGGEVGVRGVWANSYAFADDRYVLDAEVRQLWAYARVGGWDRVELGLHLPYEWRGGGVMDGFIEGFHSAFGLPDMDRDRRPRDRFLVTGVQRDGSVFSLDHPGYGFSDLIVEPRVLLYQGDALLPAASLTARLRLPTGRRKFQLSDGVDASIALDLSKRLGTLPLVAYATLAYTYHAHAHVGGLRLARHRFLASIGLEWEITPLVSLVVHTWLETPNVRGLYDDPPPPGAGPAKLSFGNYVSYVAVGFRAEPLPGLLVDLGILENILDPETTADFGVLANVAYRF